MNILWLWLIWLAAFPVLEGYALWHKNDKAEPLTYYVRDRFMHYSRLFYWLVLVSVAWLFVHFAFGVG